MNVELMVLHDGGVVLAADKPFPHVVKRVEYYNEQQLMMVVYHEDDAEGQLLNYEAPSEMVDRVLKSPNVIIYALFPDNKPFGYKAPLIKVGELY